jgi:hypothetical protein
MPLLAQAGRRAGGLAGGQKTSVLSRCTEQGGRHFADWILLIAEDNQNLKSSFPKSFAFFGRMTAFSTFLQ